MISEVVFFTVLCDRCGKMYCKDDDESMVRLFNNREELEEELNEAGWVINKRVLCKECYKNNKQLKIKGK